MIYSGRKIIFIPGDAIRVTQPAAAAAVPAWIPTDIAGLALWIDFSDATKLFTDAGTTPVSSDGDAIYQANDKSGNNRHITQSTSGARPAYKTNVQNGLSIARFDGSSDFFSVPNFLTALSIGEVFIVVKIDTDPPANAAQTGLWKIGSDTVATHFPYTDSGVYDDFGSTVRKTSGNPTAALTTPRTYHVISKSSLWTSWVNETQHYTTATNTVEFTIAGTIGKSSDAGNSYFLDGDIAEIVLYGAELSSADKALVAGYLTGKWAHY